MKLFEYLKLKQRPASDEAETATADATGQSDGYEEERAEEKEEMGSATKVKIVAALLIVGFATYIAYWVQEPSQLHADVLSTGEATVTVEGLAELAQTGFTQEVSIVDFTFDPATVTVEKGTTVVWTNKDPVPHTVTGATFSSGTLNAGDTFSYTFNADGEFEYTCSFHPQMKGKVAAGQVPAETVEMLTDQPIEELSPAAPEGTGEVEAVTPDTEVILPEAAPAVIFDAQSLVSELAAPDLEAPLSGAAQQAAVLNAAAAEQTAGELADSGPEDLLYVALFGVILYFNRRTRAKRV